MAVDSFRLFPPEYSPAGMSLNESSSYWLHQIKLFFKESSKLFITRTFCKKFLIWSNLTFYRLLNGLSNSNFEIVTVYKILCYKIAYNLYDINFFNFFMITYI